MNALRLIKILETSTGFSGTVKSSTVTLLVLILIHSACDMGNLKTSDDSRDMISMLSNYADSARRSTAYPYFNEYFVRKFEHLLKGTPPGMQPGRRLDYFLLLLMKGDNQKCIIEIERYLEKMNNNNGINARNLPFYKILALAYLRQGEQTNCINNHSQESCIIPLSNEGIHKDTDGVEAAKEIYLKLLNNDPSDIQSKWFLNICYMAQDQFYKEKPFQMDPAQFISDTAFRKFNNIAMHAKVAANNHAGGSSIEDFNNDGLLDIFTTSYSLGDNVHLYINNGNGYFEDATNSWGLEGFVGGLNNIHGDFNNDGLTDIFITRGAWLNENGHLPNSLLINTGDNRFDDQTKAYGLLTFHPTGTAAAADFNLDGHLDLFIGNESNSDENMSELYLNNGNGTFNEVSENVGLQINTWVKGAIWGDFNNDMMPDLFVSVYGGSNLLYMNRGAQENGGWRFEETSDGAGVSEPIFSFPAFTADLNNDGFMDIVVFSYDNRNPEKIAEITFSDNDKLLEAHRPRIYINNGNETFRDVSIEMGMARAVFAMGANFGDLDNDGYSDFYTGTGEFNMWASVPNKMFRNNGGKDFQDITTAGGFGQIQKGHGIAFGDLDNDGDQDIYHQVGGAAEGDVFFNMLFENPGFDNNWISIVLEGTKSNRSAIGAKIEVSGKIGSKEVNFYHWVGTGGSFGANSLRAEIGLGELDIIAKIKVHWPNADKDIQIFEDVRVNQHYYLKQEEDLVQRNLSMIKFRQSGHTKHAM